MPVEEFKTRREREKQEAQDQMVDMLQKTITRVEKGEISAVALATVTISGQPAHDWKGWNGASLGHAISRLFHVYYRRQTE